MAEPLIFQKIPKLMEAIGAIPKSGRNKTQNYRFRKVDDVLDRLYPVLLAEKCFIVPAIQSHQVTTLAEKRATGGDRTIFHASLVMQISIYAEDGSCIIGGAAGEGMDYGGDKATNKAMSAAFKYAIGFAFCIPYMDVEDSDRDERRSDAPREEPQGETTTQLQTDGQGKRVEYDSSPCGDERIGRIVDLAEKLGLTPADIKAKILPAYEVERAASLTVVQAEEIIGRLKQKLAEREAQKTF